MPVFTLSDGKLLTPSKFLVMLRHFLHGVPNLHRYGTHSFRIVAASAASKHGVHPDVIKRAGRWKSAAYTGYIRNDVSDCPRLF